MQVERDSRFQMCNNVITVANAVNLLNVFLIFKRPYS